MSDDKPELTPQQAADRLTELLKPELERMLPDLLEGKRTLASVLGYTGEKVYEIAEIGHRFLREGNHEDALVVFKGLTTLNPLDANLWVWLGSTYHNMENVDEAVVAYSRALQCDPTHVTALANRGELRLIKKEHQAGFDDLKTAVQNDPKGEDPTTVRARAILATVAQQLRKRQQESKA